MSDGRHDFDFLLGTWTVVSRRLTDMLDPQCETWEEFTGTQQAAPILHGTGNTDLLRVEALPGSSEPFEGFTLRLYDPADDVWRIWWSSTARPGRLDPPVEGRFTDGEGVFDATDTVDGVTFAVRFHWTDTDTDSPAWRQDFSFDDGATWRTTWTMRFTHAAG